MIADMKGLRTIIHSVVAAAAVAVFAWAYAGVAFAAQEPISAAAAAG